MPEPTRWTATLHQWKSNSVSADALELPVLAWNGLICVSIEAMRRYLHGKTIHNNDSDFGGWHDAGW
jgi:hypothetical protein